MSSADEARESVDPLPDREDLLTSAFGRPRRPKRGKPSTGQAPSLVATAPIPAERATDPGPPAPESPSATTGGETRGSATGPIDEVEAPRLPAGQKPQQSGEPQQSGADIAGEPNASTAPPAVESSDGAPDDDADADDVDEEYDRNLAALSPHTPYPTTISVAPDLHIRFRRYQEKMKRGGRTYSNVQVVLDAFNACHGRYDKIWAARQRPAPAPAGLPFSGYAPYRQKRDGTGRLQIAIRFTLGEIDQVETFKIAAAGPRVRRSRFIEAVLEEFLPRPKPRGRQVAAARAAAAGSGGEGQPDRKGEPNTRQGSPR